MVGQLAKVLMPSRISRFLEGSWYAPVAGERFDLVVANPPYVAAGDPHLAEGNLRFEPPGALTDGSRDEVMSYFTGIAARPRQLLALPKSWRRWATADREPIARWSFGRVTLLGDAAHPMMQYLAQGACMALEDAVTLGEALAAEGDDLERGFARYESARIARTARVVLLTREMGRIYHAKGVERLVRNQLWKDRTPERYYDAVEWLYGWKVEECLR